MTQVALGTEIGPLLAGQAKVAVMYEPGLDQAVAKGMKVVLGFPKFYGEYAFSAITARTDVDPDSAQRFVNGIEMALRYIQENPAGAIAIAKKEFPTLDPVVVENAVKRMIAENIYPKSVAIKPDALTVAMDTQIGLGNLAAQPVYDKLIATPMAKKAVAMK
jgi:NitT/TauT family transport system substrate-binding protein